MHELTQSDFTEHVHLHFNYLTDLGFERQPPKQKTWITALSVRYEDPADGRCITIWYTPARELEVILLIEGHGYYLTEIIRAVDPDKAKHYKAASFTEVHLLESYLKEAADLVQDTCPPVLANDRTVLDQLTSIQEVHADKTLYELKASKIRPRAEAAFNAKSYEEAFFLYAGMMKALTPSERKRMWTAGMRARKELT